MTLDLVLTRHEVLFAGGEGELVALAGVEVDVFAVDEAVDGDGREAEDFDEGAGCELEDGFVVVVC